MGLSNEQIYQLVLQNGLVDEAKLKELNERAAKEKVPLSDLLLSQNLLSDENLGILIADQLHLPFISLNKVSVPQDVLTIIPEVVAKKKKVFVFGKTNEGIRVAMSQPIEPALQQSLQKKSGQNIIPYYATERDIEGALHLYHKDLQRSFDDMVSEHVEAAKRSANNELSISKIVDSLIEHAHQNAASDIHIEPEEDETIVRFRIDGILHEVLHLPCNIHEQLVSRVKVLARLRTDEHLSAQDGKIHHKMGDQDIDVRVSVVPIVGGEKVVMRLLASSKRQLSLKDIGLSDKDYEKVLNGFTKPHGMVLSTGPTGSGKSTSIYAMIHIVNTREINIATIEDPVEYEIEGVNQIQVNSKTNLSFANGLRAILRQDPDVIFVGEIRDEETASIAINSAMTGHLVFSTLHTNDAATTLPRLIDMNIEPFLVASTVNVIIGQRLVRRICEKCRFSLTKDPKEFGSDIPVELMEKTFGSKKEIRVYQGQGCSVCHGTGYQGRIGIFEVLEVTEQIRKLIIQKAPADQITQQAVKEGMTTMLEDGLGKVKLGLTTVDEILRATKA